jgi:hypothetical protein
LNIEHGDTLEEQTIIACEGEGRDSTSEIIWTTWMAHSGSESVSLLARTVIENMEKNER